jgi:hypothetical protein
MAIIDDFKALNDALGRIQGRIPKVTEPDRLPCGQAPSQSRGVPMPGPIPPPVVCSYCKGSGFVVHPNGSGGNKPYPCPQCNGDVEVKF